MVPVLTCLYGSVLALFFLVLSVQVIRSRQVSRVAIGTGGQPRLERAMRVHANFAEYVPLALILFLLAELARYPRPILHVVGIALVAGRAIHAFGVSRDPEDFRFRTVGVGLTFTVLTALAVMTLLAGLL